MGHRVAAWQERVPENGQYQDELQQFNLGTMVASTYHVTFHHGRCRLLKRYTVGFAGSAGYKYESL